MGRAFEVRKVAKAKTAAAKTKVYSKYGREILVAAKAGVPDPDSNLELKRVIEKAKKDQVPNDIINRAIEKAKGNTDENYTQVRYEGFGPGESMVIIETLTDNVNRTIAEIRTVLNKTGGKLGVGGSVCHQFNHDAVIVTKSLNEEEVLEALINNDVDVKNIETENDLVTIYGDVADFNKIRNTLLNYKENVELEMDEITWHPFTYVNIGDEHKEKFNRLIEMLEDLDDVQDVYHNVENI